ncbi:hypothetical protein ACYCCF_16760 [Streptomyces argenteolus]|uniref:hypothetical protein n=1 Tax=Streptomyces sp. NPDC025273 TaxID=3155251 RepID=UPI00340087DA
MSVPLLEGAAALKERTGGRGVSAYVGALVRRRSEREVLRGLIDDAEADQGHADRAGVEVRRAPARGSTTDPADAS